MNVFKWLFIASGVAFACYISQAVQLTPLRILGGIVGVALASAIIYSTQDEYGFSYETLFAIFLWTFGVVGYTLSTLPHLPVQ